MAKNDADKPQQGPAEKLADAPILKTRDQVEEIDFNEEEEAALDWAWKELEREAKASKAESESESESEKGSQ